MNDRLPEDDEHRLPLRVTLQIDALCDEFESTFDGPEVPLLAPFVDRVDPDGRTPLLEELVALAMEHLQKYGIKDAAGAMLQANESLRDELTPLIPDAAATTPHTPRDPNQPCVGRGLHVRCPHCHNPIELVPDGALENIHCEACGSYFSLTSEGTETRAAREVTQIGHFKLVERIGMGAFGSVWKALDMELDRTVAVKIPRHGNLQQNAFLREARAAAQLHHPYIVPVHEVGRDGDLLYIVSDLIRGITLADWLTGQQLTFREAAELCVKIAEALHYAHEHGVIHRDLKPGNIMVGEEGEPHLMDFGLARREAGEITMTLDGQVLGTPAYMSPEQAQGEAHKADRRSDIYSLGVILFQLSTGELPFRGNARMLMHQVIHDEPPSPRKLNGSVPRDLETICLKCVEKEPGNRYETARALGDDFRRFLNGESIEARPVGRMEQAWRWCKRKPVVSGLTTAFIVAIVVGLGGITWQWIRAEREAEQNRRFLYVSDMNVALQAWNGANIMRVEDLLKRHGPRMGKEDLRGFEWYYLWRLCERARHADTIKQPGRARSIAVSPGNDLLAVGYANGLVCLWDLGNEKNLRSFRDPRDIWRIDGEYEWERPCIAFSPDGETLAYPGPDYEQIICHSLDTDDKQTLDGHGVKFLGVTFSPDGQFVATQSVDLSTKLWDLKSGTSWDIPSVSVKPSSEHYVRTDYYKGVVGLAFDRGSTRLATGNVDKSIVVWDVNTHESVNTLKGHPGLGWAVAFSPDPDRELLALGSRDGKVRLWDLATGVVKELIGHSDEVRSMAFAPKGDILASGSRDNTAILWDTTTYRKIESLKGHSHNVESLAFWQDGETLKLVTGSSDRTVKCWVVGQSKQDTLSLGEPVNELELSPDGKTMASRQLGPQEVTLWDLKKGKAQPTPINVDGRTSSIAISTEYLAVGVRGKVQLWRLDGLMEAGNALQSKTKANIIALTFSPLDDGILAAGSEDGHVIAWNVRNRVKLFEISGHSGCVTAVSFTPRGDTVASASDDRTVKLWELPKGDPINTILASDDHVMCVAFSNNGRFLASGGYDNMVKLWPDWRLGKTVARRTLAGHSDGILSIMFPPDQRTLITGCGDCTVKVWDIRTQQVRLTLNEHTSAVACAALSSDGTLLVSGSRNGTIRFWRAATKEEVQASGGYEE